MLSNLALNAANIIIIPESVGENEKAVKLPRLRWRIRARRSLQEDPECSNRYWSVNLDNPSFSQPIQCVFVKVEDIYQLDWNRQSPHRPIQPGQQTSVSQCANDA